jgi:hypothetical protein
MPKHPESELRLNLPLLKADETLYSWCGTVHSCNGNTNVLDTSRQLFGVPYAALLHDFPSHLATFDQRTLSQVGAPEDIALRHTLLGYYLPLISLDRAQQILSAIQIGGISHLKMSLGIPASRVGAAHPLKACEKCRAEDTARFGVAFWHVSHQYPSALVCSRHLCLLKSLWIRGTPVHRRKWLFPSGSSEGTWIEAPVLSGTRLERLIKLAECSTLLAQLPPGSLDHKILAATYRKAMSELGMTSLGGNLRLHFLQDWIHRYYDGLENLAGLDTLKSIDSDHPGILALSRHAPRSGHPCKHLLLISALFESWSAFEESYRIAGRETDLVSVSSTEMKQGGDERFHEFAELITRGSTVTAAAKLIGVTTTTGVRWAKIHGVQFTSRASKLRPRVLDAARKLLVAGEDKSKICRRVGISLVSLNRLISSEPNIAEMWRRIRQKSMRDETRRHFDSLLASHPGWGIREIRRIPLNGYPWLYRNDRAWLTAQLLARQRN